MVLATNLNGANVGVSGAREAISFTLGPAGTIAMIELSGRRPTRNWSSTLWTRNTRFKSINS